MLWTNIQGMNWLGKLRSGWWRCGINPICSLAIRQSDLPFAKIVCTNDFVLKLKVLVCDFPLPNTPIQRGRVRRDIGCTCCHWA